MIQNDSSQPMLNNKQQSLLNQLLSTLNQEQKVWLGGYLSGLSESTNTLLKLLNPVINGSFTVIDQNKPKEPLLTIMYGTRSGNSKKLANKAQKQAESLGIPTSIVDLNDYDPKKIKKEKNILVIVSTDGEGEPTLSTEEFYNYLFSKKAPKLNDLKYSVLALGDKTYQHFCKVGRDIDERLLELGADRSFERIDCDVDFEEVSVGWLQNNLKQQKELLGDIEDVNAQILPTPPAVETGTKESPYKAQILDKFKLSGRDSSKNTWHIEFSIEDSGIQYQPGDSLGIKPYNSADFVDFFTKELKLNGDAKVTTYNGVTTLKEALKKQYEISALVPAVITEFSKATGNKKLAELTSDAAELEKYSYGRDIIDLVQDFKLKLTEQELIDNLRKLQPRLYSIASSYNYNQDEVHLTVSQVEYNTNKRSRKGVCSNFLADISEEELIEIYIDENISFRLPDDAHVPVIMIGAGTGVAPFRAFLQERSLSGVKSKNWLFFGERNFTSDFLYQTEWQKYHKNGLLTNIDLAFSRDQKEKVYVQDKLLQNSKEVYKWIQQGAHIYLCGDKNAMARDVKKALIQIFKTEGGFSEGGAEDYFRQLRRDRQFQEDVY